MTAERSGRTAFRLAAVVSGALLIAALSGCSSQNPSDFTGTWSSDHPAGTTLDLKDGGQLSGNDGCNSLTGSWTESKNTITFSKLASTQMACDGVDAWLGKAASARTDGDTLNVYDSDGTQIGVLDR